MGKWVDKGMYGWNNGWMHAYMDIGLDRWMSVWTAGCWMGGWGLYKIPSTNYFELIDMKINTFLEVHIILYQV